MTSLVAMYEKGAITADHLVVECLHMLDPENPAVIPGRLSVTHPGSPILTVTR
jgi:hypothetical protein